MRRVLLTVPLLLAAVLTIAVAPPLRARAERARDAYAEARRERQQLQAQIAPLERRERARRQAAAVFAHAGEAEGGPAAIVRRAVLAHTEQAGATRVRLAVRSAGGAVAVRLSAEAPYAAAVRLPGEVARPEAGLVLQRVRLSRGKDARVSLELEAVAPLGGP
jgi:hypothetical protein